MDKVHHIFTALYSLNLYLESSFIVFFYLNRELFNKQIISFLACIVLQFTFDEKLQLKIINFRENNIIISFIFSQLSYQGFMGHVTFLKEGQFS